MKQPKGAVSTASIIGIVVVIVAVIGIIYWYSAYSQNPALQTGTEASSTTPGTDASDNAPAGTSITTTSAGAKQYSNFTYGYAVSLPADTQRLISNPANVLFSFKEGTSTVSGTLSISVNNDVTHLGYCLIVPQNATTVATTTVNGVGFLSYVVGSGNINSGTTYYRLIHTGPSGKQCYDIQKSPQGSATLNGKLNNVLQSFTFITSA